MVLVLLCLASVWSNILCFNFAIICINDADSRERAGPVPISGAVLGINDTTVGLLDPNSTFTTTTSPMGGNGTTEEVGLLEEEKASRFTPRQRLYLTSAVAAAALLSNFAVVSLVRLRICPN